MAQLERRTFLRGTAMTAVLAGVSSTGILTACGSDDDASGDLDTLTLQLSWIKNIQFAGCFVADSEGYYRDAGFSKTTILPGGPNTAPATVVNSGKALSGFISLPSAASAILEGADIRIIGTKYQRNPSGIASLADNPILEPGDLVGKSVGVPAASLPEWNRFLSVNGIAESDVKTVSVQFDPQPLLNGEVDGWYSFVISQPNQLRARGADVEFLSFHDHGLATVAEGYIVRTETLESDKEALVNFMTADVRGWRKSVEDPDLAVDLTVEKYGKDLKLDLETTRLEIATQNELVLTDTSREQGLAYVSPDQQAEAVAVLGLGGIDIDAATLFDMSVLDAVYKDEPDLKNFDA